MLDVTSSSAVSIGLKQWRGLATRYEKRAANYRALVVIASIVIWLDA
jgi:transposase